MVITKKKILKTALMPEYLPRLYRLFGSGFGNLAFLITLVFNTVRIIPDNHPYLNPAQKGTYGIRHAIAEAANNITVKKENIDQIIIFFSIIAAIIILFIQFILLIMALMIPKSYAQGIPNDIREFFVTPSPENDLAFELLNLVFGVPSFFGGAAETTQPIHQALHALFEFYSLGILIVGTFIILYMVVTTIGETAQSGVPFGRRFNKSWTPIRIVIFFALLLPITLGLNSAQYITLMSAKLGSGLATQGWILYNNTLAQNNYTPGGEEEQLVAIPKKQDLMHLPAFMTVVKTCAIAYDSNYSQEHFPDPWATRIRPWAVYESSPNQWQAVGMLGTTYENLTVASKTRDIHIVFGVRDYDLYNEHKGNIGPICGSLILKVTDVSEPGAAVFRRHYYDIVRNLWTGSGDSPLYGRVSFYAREYFEIADPMAQKKRAILPTAAYKKQWEDYFQQKMEGAGGVVQEAVDAQIASGTWQVDNEIIDLGWAGAGIWYNKIAEQNGALIAALRTPPVPMLYPRMMDKIEKQNRRENEGANPLDRYTLTFSTETQGIFSPDYENMVARSLNYAYIDWNKQESGENVDIAKTGNAFIDIINVVLGTQGLFEICSNTHVHPLAQLSALGKSMLDNSIRAFGGSALFAIFGVQPLFVQTTSAISEFFGTIAGVGLLIGFILFYVLPFMPFIYFFFAVGSWIKTIFEAMVGLPLWALAHLRIDGEGVMGDAAMSGYYLIFEIFIRPILVIFGFIASIVIFAVMVKALNQVFYMVIANLSGHAGEVSAPGSCFQNPNATAAVNETVQQAELKDAYRGPLDEFFFTVLYTIVVYMIGTSCFKLIDSIPDNMLRWLDADASSFGDNAGDEAEGLMTYITIGGSQFGSQIGESLSGVGSGLKKDTSDLINSISA